ncbi:MAG: XdhC family protein, partial [Anaerolineae bacterium]
MDLFPLLQDYIQQEKAVVLATVIDGPDDLVGAKMLVPAEGELRGSLLAAALRDEVINQARRLLYQERSVVQTFGQARVFFDVYSPPLQLIVVGAVHVAISLVTFA